MPWYKKPMKDVLSCDKPRGAAKKRYYSGISEWENPPTSWVPYTEYIGV